MRTNRHAAVGGLTRLISCLSSFQFCTCIPNSSFDGSCYYKFVSSEYVKQLRVRNIRMEMLDHKAMGRARKDWRDGDSGVRVVGEEAKGVQGRWSWAEREAGMGGIEKLPVSPGNEVGTGRTDQFKLASTLFFLQHFLFTLGSILDVSCHSKISAKKMQKPAVICQEIR